MFLSYISSGQLPQLLSPTLPAQFPVPKISTDDSSDKLNDSDIDNLPILLLSPTLPTIFAPSPKLEQKELKEPKSEPKKPSTVDSVLGEKEKTPKSSPVRWINKLNDPNKPRFLLRVSLLPLKFDVFRSPQGLGISEAKEPQKESVKEKPDPARVHWLKTARDLATDGKDNLTKIVLQFDRMLCLAIANDADEKHRKSVAERHWVAFLDEFEPLVNRIEKFLITNNIHDKKKAYLSFLVGVLFCMKALVVKRINGLISANLRAASDPKKQSLFSHTIIRNHELISEHLATAQTFFVNCPSPSTVFPKSWHNRHSLPGKTSSDGLLNPSTDHYYAPLGSYSDLRDAAGYLYCCLREFCELHASEMGTKYVIQAGKKF